MTLFSPGDLVRARGREWVSEPSPRDGWLALRPLSGSEGGSILIDPTLEIEPVAPARFDLPLDARPAVQSMAALLADALRLSLRRGAGPFRSAAQIGFEPRIYQLVPLLMALRQAVPRLLIADDVGIGKTLEAGLILRELMDRGEVDAFTVLCPPHLVDQWTGELERRFGIEATAVTAGSAARLERGLPIGQTLFDAHRHTVVSLDYIKAERRRDAFARACPPFVIVDEAHACTGTKGGRQQRFALLETLARDEERAVVLLTATPHSGDAEAFARLLSLLSPEFAEANLDDPRVRERLARHFVQRRRRDLETEGWDEERAFPRHLTRDEAYQLDEAHRAFHEAVLDYCFGVVERAGTGQRERRLAFWGTLALMRCVGSSPAAALSALRTRAGDGDRLEGQVFDEDSDDEDAVDLEPAADVPGDPALAALLARAVALAQAPDPKVTALVRVLRGLITKGAKPVVFCRYIATARHVAAELRRAFPRYEVAEVTGLLTSDERRERVAALADHDQRILVATDCLSEGINLQLLFDACLHYDLSWNPTRHQQREGRVNRFGQPSPEVHSVLMYSPDSAIDGAVLEVILNKAKMIREATGVTVPLPDERGPVTDALMGAILLRKGGTRRQLTLDLRLEDGRQAMEAMWRDAEENERRSRARFAQNALKPAEVAPEWQRARAAIGGPDAARRFISGAMRRFDAPFRTEGPGLHDAVLADLPSDLRDRLAARGLKGTIRLAEAEPVPSRAGLLTRTHPLTTTLAEALVEGALDPSALPDLGIGRVGAWPTPAVTSRTLLLLLRLRFKLTVHARQTRLLLAEDTSLVAVASGAVVAEGETAREMLATTASGDLALGARDRLIDRAREELPALLDGPLAEHARARAEALIEDHRRLQAAARGFSAVTVEPALPPDVIGLFVLTPGA